LLFGATVPLPARLSCALSERANWSVQIEAFWHPPKILAKVKPVRVRVCLMQIKDQEAGAGY